MLEFRQTKCGFDSRCPLIAGTLLDSRPRLNYRMYEALKDEGTSAARLIPIGTAL